MDRNRIAREVGRSILTSRIGSELAYRYANGMLFEGDPFYWIARAMDNLADTHREWDLTDLVAAVKNQTPKSIYEMVFLSIGGVGLFLTNCVDSVEAP